MKVAMRQSSRLSVSGVGLDDSQVRDELLPHRLRNRRPVAFEPRESVTQGAFAGRGHLVSDRVIVAQVERAQQRPQRESLKSQRAEHDGERGQDDQVAKRKGRAAAPAPRPA